MANAHCKSCNKLVGVNVERPKGKIWFGIIGAVVSFIWLLSQIKQGYSVGGSSISMQVTSAPSDAMLIIPAGFLIFAIYAGTKLAIHKCSLCGLEFPEKNSEDK